MRKEAPDDVAAAARRRLDQLGAELARSGFPARPRLRGPDDPEETSDVRPAAVPLDVPVARALAEPGRHARRRGTPVGARAAGAVRARLPFDGRILLRRSHLVVVVALVVLGVGIAAWGWLRAGSRATALPASRPVAELATTTPTGSPGSAAAAVPGAARASSATASGASSAAAGRVVIDVAGKVRRPGIASLPAGSRVADALRAAGGARRGADLTGLNLARVLTDGEQVLVGVPAATGIGSGTGAGAAASAASPGTPLVDLNTATEEQLESLPGVGPVTAQKILDWRTGHHTFTSVQELLEIDGIGDKTLARLTPYVTL